MNVFVGVAIAGAGVAVYYFTKKDKKPPAGDFTYVRPTAAEAYTAQSNTIHRHNNQLCHNTTCCPRGGSARVWTTPAKPGAKRKRYEGNANGKHMCTGQGITPYEVMWGPGCGC